MINDAVSWLAGIGIMVMGYFIGRIIEAATIGSWNYPKEAREVFEKLDMALERKLQEESG